MFGNLRRCKECGESYYQGSDDVHECDIEQKKEYLARFAREVQDPARIQIFILQVEKYLLRQANR